MECKVLQCEAWSVQYGLGSVNVQCADYRGEAILFVAFAYSILRLPRAMAVKTNTTSYIAQPCQLGERKGTKTNTLVAQVLNTHAAELAHLPPEMITVHHALMQFLRQVWPNWNNTRELFQIWPMNPRDSNFHQTPKAYCHDERSNLSYDKKNTADSKSV